MVVLVTWKNEEDLIKNNKVNAWTPFFQFFFKRSRADNSTARGRIWQNFELIRALMNAVVPCEYGKDLIENIGDNAWTTFSSYKVFGDFSNAQGQITPRPVVGSG